MTSYDEMMKYGWQAAPQMAESKPKPDHTGTPNPQHLPSTPTPGPRSAPGVDPRTAPVEPQPVMPDPGTGYPDTYPSVPPEEAPEVDPNAVPDVGEPYLPTRGPDALVLNMGAGAMPAPPLGQMVPYQWSGGVTVPSGDDPLGQFGPSGIELRRQFAAGYEPVTPCGLGAGEVSIFRDVEMKREREVLPHALFIDLKLPCPACGGTLWTQRQRERGADVTLLCTWCAVTWGAESQTVPIAPPPPFVGVASEVEVVREIGPMWGPLSIKAGIQTDWPCPTDNTPLFRTVSEQDVVRLECRGECGERWTLNMFARLIAELRAGDPSNGTAS